MTPQIRVLLQLMPYALSIILLMYYRERDKYPIINKIMPYYFILILIYLAIDLLNIW